MPRTLAALLAVPFFAIRCAAPWEPSPGADSGALDASEPDARRPDGGVGPDAGPPLDAGEVGSDSGTCAAPTSCAAQFAFPADGGVATVVLHGDFNGWGAGVPMQLSGSAWTASVPGVSNGQKVVYKFVLNGTQWVTDPSNPDTVPDGLGGKNSVRTIQCGGCAADAGAVDAGPPLCDVKKFGATGDGTTKDTAALQAAINACAGTGGTVYLHDGTFFSGMLTLQSNMTFYLDGSATLLGSQDDTDYPDTHPPTANTQLGNCRKALVYAQSATNLTIDGSGTINGNGNKAEWVGVSASHTESKRPMPFYTALSNNVLIQNITIRDGAMWGLVNLETDNLTIRNVTIHSLLSGNRDGIDVVDCHHVLIDGCTIASEDDSICLKSGVRRGVQDVTVSNCLIQQSSIANGLKFGTASYGALQNVSFHDIVIDQVDKAAMAVEAVDGADISNVSFQRITVGTAGSPIFILLGDRGSTPSNDVHKIGSIDSVSFTDVTVKSTKHTWGSPISGSIIDGGTYPLTHLSFTRVNTVVSGGVTSVPADPPEYAGQYPDPNLWGDLPAFDYFVRHANGVTFTNSPTTAATPDARTWLQTRDVNNLTVQ